MNAPASTAQGCIFIAVQMPSPWPNETTTLYRQRLSDGSIRLALEPSLRIRTQLIAAEPGGDKVLLEALSCPISISIFPPSRAVIDVTWTVPNLLQTRINANLVSSISSEDKVPPRFDLRAPRVINPTDFSQENVLASSRRHDTLVGSMSQTGRGGRIYGGKDYILSALQTEVSQITDLLTLMRSGKTDHASGLASRLRMLIATGDPLPLLQLAAATIGQPLIVYSHRRFEIPELSFKPTQRLGYQLSFQPSGLSTSAVDLDVWLDFQAGEIDGHSFTNRRLLNKIGDTIGSHLDPYLHPYVEMLRGLSAGVSGRETPRLVEYLVRVADVILQVSQRLLTIDAQKSAI